ERAVAFETADTLDAVEQAEAEFRTRCEGDGNRSIQLDHGGRVAAEELVVQEHNLRPVGFSRGRSLGVDSGDRRLDLIGRRTLHAERAFDQTNALFDFGALPASTVLVLE